MKKVIRLSESDLIRLVKRVIKEERYGSFGNMKRPDFKGDTYLDDDDRFVDDEKLLKDARGESKLLTLDPKRLKVFRW